MSMLQSLVQVVLSIPPPNYLAYGQQVAGRQSNGAAITTITVLCNPLPLKYIFFKEQMAGILYSKKQR